MKDPPIDAATTCPTTLAEQARSLAAGAVTSAALVERSLARIAETRDTLNAFRAVRSDAARAEAARADERRAAGETGPLLGAVVAIKDDTDIAGLATAFGCAGDFPQCQHDAEVVRRFRAAGAVVVGKTNTPEIGQWPFTEGAAFGVTRNPWNPEHTPGGSSGGSAAAVAAGLVGAALGSDGAGSVRIPAAWTNLVGVKPGNGVIPNDPEVDPFYGLTVHGPLARTVADAAALLDVAAGTGSTYQGAAGREPRRLRIGVTSRVPFVPVATRAHPQVRAGVRRLARTLATLGHEVVDVRPRFGLVGLSFVPRSLAGLAAWAERVPDRELLDPRTRQNVRSGARLAGPALRAALAARPALRHRVAASIADVDVLLAPSTASPPPAVGHFDGRSGWSTTRAIIAACPYAWPWNVLGWPAAGVPAGFTGSGLPVGAQLLGREGSEELLLSLAAELEHAEGWPGHRPG